MSVRAQGASCDVLRSHAWSRRTVRDFHHGRNPDRSSLHDVRKHARANAEAFNGAKLSTSGRAAYEACARRSREPDWWSQTGSNRRPPACKAGALPAELWPPPEDGNQSPAIRQHTRVLLITDSDHRSLKLVGLGRFELPTSRLSSARSNQLSYKPVPGISHQ
jgi:hypothetical protein